MSEDLVLVAETGRETGTRPSRRMRREGNVPATLYGLGKDAQTIAVAWRELRQVLTTDAGVNAFIHLEVDGSRQATLVKDIQRHPVRRDVIHVDFLRVDEVEDVDGLRLVEGRGLEIIFGEDDKAALFVLVAFDEILPCDRLAFSLADALVAHRRFVLGVQQAEFRAVLARRTIELDRDIDEPERQRALPD